MNRAKFELLGWLILFLILYGLALAYDGHEALDIWMENHESMELDEIFVALNIGGALGLIYSLFRVRDLSREIARRRTAEENVDWLACHDPLTDLPNRRYLDSVCKTVAPGRPGHRDLTVFSIDLDGFKTVNDLLGHHAGDQVLKTVADRLRQVFPKEDIFRLGGDEFLVIADRHRLGDALAAGERIARLIAKPISTDSAQADIGASVGFTHYPENAADLRDAISQSDCAMYKVKRQGRNGVMAFEASMQDDLQRRMKLEADLRLALRNNQITPYYQPCVDLRTRKVIGFEALARWERAPGEFIPPSEFIAVAEETGLIVELTDVLFRHACRDALQWPDDLVLSFNISPVQLSDRLLGLRLLRVIGEVGLAVNRVELEVTETALIKDDATAKLVLDGLTAAGIKIALDDFGTGFSSLSQLSNHRFDKIKIDKSFIDTFESNEKQDKVVKAIIALGAGLGVKVTAEGIEQESQLTRLQALGCDIGQGYLLGHPAPKADVAAHTAQGADEAGGIPVAVATG
jgi:diguanylate cyclase (GGDEF)-like protein